MVPRPQNGLSLCSGGGGLDLGLGLAEPGYHTRCFVEWEAAPRDCLVDAMRAGNIADAPIWDDLTTFDARPFAGAIDTLIAGYPCQPFSLAGQRKGANDERHLWPHVARVARELGPGLRFLFLENVRGHLSLGGDAVLRELHEMGYVSSAGIFSAGETGATHERQRLFIVACRRHQWWRADDAGWHDADRTDAGWAQGDGGAGKRGKDVADAQGDDGRGELQQGGAGCRRVGPAGSDPELADADGGNASAERQQRGGQFGFQPQCRGAGEPVVGHPESIGRGKGRAEPALRIGGSPLASAGGDALDNPAGPRHPQAGVWADIGGDGIKRGQPLSCDRCRALDYACSIRSDPRRGRQDAGNVRQQPAAECPRCLANASRDRGAAGFADQARRGEGDAGKPINDRPFLHPPGPRALGDWAAAVWASPDLAPAISRAWPVHASAIRLASVATEPGQTQPAPDPVAATAKLAAMDETAFARLVASEGEPLVCRMADGMAGRTRSLKILGNGVHPLAAAHAWRSLSLALGLRPLDLGAAAGDGPAADSAAAADGV